jgi:hypothetical protein
LQQRFEENAFFNNGGCKHYVARGNNSNCANPHLCGGEICPFPDCDFISFRGGVSKHMGHKHRCKRCMRYTFECNCF